MHILQFISIINESLIPSCQLIDAPPIIIKNAMYVKVNCSIYAIVTIICKYVQSINVFFLPGNIILYYSGNKNKTVGAAPPGWDYTSYPCWYRRGFLSQLPQETPLSVKGTSFFGWSFIAFDGHSHPICCASARVKEHKLFWMGCSVLVKQKPYVLDRPTAVYFIYERVN